MASLAGKNLLLLALVVILALMVWMTPDRERGEALPRLTHLSAGQISRVRLTNDQGAQLLLQKQAGRWQMRAPYQTLADQSRVSKLLEIATAPSLERLSPPTGSLAEFGLSPPRALLRLDDLELAVGGTEPVNHHRYLLVEGRLHLIRDRFPHHLLARSEAYVSPRLIPRGSRLTAIHTPEWQLTTSPGQPLSKAQQQKVALWQQAVATEVTSAPDTPDQTQVTLSLEGGERRLLGVIREENGGLLLVAWERGLAYRMENGEALLSAPQRVSDP